MHDPQASFPVRNLSFDFSAVPDRWHGDRAAGSLFFDNLSTLFPLGERFFIRSVVHYRDRVKDPKLRADVRAFTSQEAIHTREHESYNRMLRRRGYDLDRMERGIARLLALPKRLHRRRAPLVSLAVTVALEHWTAMLGHFVLEDDSIMDGADPQMAAIWRWHAAEECEHKSVAIDVYEQAAQGGYWTRVLVMLVTSLLFWGRILRQQWMMMRADGIAFSAREWLDLGRFLFVEQRALKRLFPIWLSFFARGFHPWQLDDASLLERWRNRPALAS